MPKNLDFLFKPVVKQVKNNTEDLNITCFVKKIEMQGFVYIEFSESMIDEDAGVDLDSINEDLLDIQIELGESTITEGTLNRLTPEQTKEFTWYPIEYKDKILTLKLKFGNPLVIALPPHQDYLNITIKDLSFFKSAKDDRKKLVTRKLRKLLRKQLDYSQLVETGKIKWPKQSRVPKNKSQPQLQWRL